MSYPKTEIEKLFGSTHADIYESMFDCADWQAEVQGWFNGAEASKKRPYDSPDEHKRLVNESGQLDKDCWVTRALHQLNVDMAVGSSTSYTVCEFKYATETPVELPKIKRELELITDSQGSFCELVRELVYRDQRDGSFLLMDDIESEDNENGAFFLERCLIDRPDGEPVEDVYDKELWDYGVVALKERPKFHLGYWVRGYEGVEGIDEQSELEMAKNSVEYGYVSVDRLTVGHRGVDIGDPFGVPRSRGSYVWSLRLHDLLKNCYDYLKCQMKSAVWKEWQNQISNETISKTAIGQSKKDRQARSNGKDPDAPGVLDTKGAKLHHPTISSIDQIMRKIEFVVGMICVQHGWMEWVLTGNFRSANQHNLAQSLRVSFEKIEAERKRYTRASVSLLWQLISQRLGISEDRLAEIRRNVKIVPEYPKLSTETEGEATDRIIKKLTAQVISKAQATRECGYDEDKMAKEVAKESERGAEGFPAALSLDNDSEDGNDGGEENET